MTTEEPIQMPDLKIVTLHKQEKIGIKAILV